MNKIHQTKSDYYHGWRTANPIVVHSQLTYEYTYGILKVGDGSSSYNNLPPILHFQDLYPLVSATNLVALDLSKALKYKLSVTENFTISLPININIGQEGIFMFEQDVTGGWTTAWNSVFKFVNIDSTVTTAGEVNVYSYIVYSATSIVLTYMGHFTA